MHQAYSNQGARPILNLLREEGVAAESADRLPAIPLRDRQPRPSLLVRLHLLQVLGPDGVLLAALLADVPGPHPLQHEPHHGPQRDEDVLADEYGDGERPPRAPRNAVGAEQVNDGPRRDAARPGQEVERADPRADAVAAHGCGSLLLSDDLEEVGAQLDDVVDEESDRDEGPDGREEGQVSKLDHNLGDVVLDVELGFKRVVLLRRGNHGVATVVSSTVVAVPTLELSLRDRDDVFLEEGGHLARQSQCDDLVAQSARIDVEGLMLVKEDPGPQGPQESPSLEAEPGDDPLSKGDI
ncbi:unnamed protein product, partial [Clonostachys solani]